jgi:alkylhydroperoxidase family enzyme
MRERELLILRVSHRSDCDYEWSIHVAGFADAAGLAEADRHATLPPRRRCRAANASCWRRPMNWWTRAS